MESIRVCSISRVLLCSDIITSGQPVCPRYLLYCDVQYRSLGSVAAPIARARKVGGFSLLFDVEERHEEEANEVVAGDTDIVMLDNMEGCGLRFVTRRLLARWAGASKKFLLEMRRGITETDIHERAISGKWIPALL